MKKFFVLAAISAAMFLMVSCGDSSSNDDKTGSGEVANDENSNDTTNEDGNSSDQEKKQGELYGECYPNKTCDEGLVCEVEDNVCIREHNDSEDDSDTENSDTADTTDTDDTDSDSGDSEADNDGDSTDSEQPETALPECSAGGETPCRNENLIWSAKADTKMNWETAKSYCENDVKEGGFTDWRLPKIDELRTLVQKCEGTVTGGKCAISDPDHLSTEDLVDADCVCDGKENGYYSKLGDDEWCWSSSSVNNEERAWYLLFNIAAIATDNKTNQHYLRCVRNAD